MEQKLQQISNQLSNIEYTLCCICNTLKKVNAEDLAILSLLGKIIKDIEGTQNGIDTANFGIDTANAGIDNANSGISTLSLDVGTANQGIEDANEAIANIDCGSCDLTEVYNKLNQIINQIPNMTCRFPRPPKPDEEEDKKTSKTTKTKKV